MVSCPGAQTTPTTNLRSTWIAGASWFQRADNSSSARPAAA